MWFMPGQLIHLLSILWVSIIIKWNSPLHAKCHSPLSQMAWLYSIWMHAVAFSECTYLDTSEIVWMQVEDWTHKTCMFHKLENKAVLAFICFSIFQQTKKICCFHKTLSKPTLLLRRSQNLLLPWALSSALRLMRPYGDRGGTHSAHRVWWVKPNSKVTLFECLPPIMERISEGKSSGPNSLFS